MKKLFLAASVLLLGTIINAQTLEEIVQKFSAANKLEKLNSLSSIKVTSKNSAMGSEMTVITYMKKPNKTKVVTNYNGQDIIVAFDGEKGYMVNPIMGQSDPVELDPAIVKQQLTNKNIFQNELLITYKNGQLSKEGEEDINGKPSYKLKENLDGGNSAYIYVDKETFLISKSTVTINAMGQTITMDIFPTEYKEINGLFIPARTTSNAAGIEGVATIEKIEVNIPMEDSIFKLK